MSQEPALVRTPSAGHWRVMAHPSGSASCPIQTDLLAPAARLVVKVGGASHAKRTTADARRDRAFCRLGYRVLRLETELVLREPLTAVERILAALTKRY